MVGKLINGASRTVIGAAVILGAASVVSRLLGLVRERVIAHEFGASGLTDIYYASFRLPDVVYNLLVLGVLSSAFIPVFTQYLVKNKKGEAWKVANGILNLLLIALVVVLGILFFTMPWVLPWVIRVFESGGHAERVLSTENIEMTVKMTRIMLLSPLILGISGVLGGVLNSFKRFFAYSLAPIFYNVGIIVGAVLGVKFFGIFGLAYGVVLGSILHAIIQLVAAIDSGYRYKFWISLKHWGIRRILMMMGPRTLGLAVNQINILVISFLALSLEEGSLSVFNYATNLQSFPLGVFAVSFAVAAFPTMSSAAGKNRLDKLMKTFSSSFRQILFYIVPASVLLLVLRAQIVRVVLGTGAFDWQDTILTAQGLGFFAVSLFAQGLTPLLVRTFYAMKNTAFPLLAALIGAGVNVGLGIWFAKMWGVLGLILAFSVASFAQMIFLLLVLHVKLKGLDDVRIMRSSIKIGVSAFVAGLVSYFSLHFFVWGIHVSTRTFEGIFLQGLFAGTVGILVYLGISLLLRSEEAIVFVKNFRRRWRRLFGEKNKET